MVQYLSLKDYSEITGRSIASVYRDAEKGLVKTTMINGKKHVILEEETHSATKDDKQKENKSEFGSHYDKNDKAYQEAEIIAEAPGIRYELEVFKNSISTIEDMALRLEAAKDETINNLKIEIEKKDKVVDNQNEIIKTLSGDNSNLRTQLGIREAEINILEKRLKEIENENSEMLLRIDNTEKEKAYNSKSGFWFASRKL